MKVIVTILMLFPGVLSAQERKATVTEIDNSIFKTDNYWRGADGAATVELVSGKILWLFSDTFIDQDGTGKRSNSRTMIRNSIALQDSGSLNAELTFYFGGTGQNPDDFFKVPGENWLWTGHGIATNSKLAVFLIEETSTDTGIGFQAVGWYVAIIDNPSDDPDKWEIHYFKGPETYGVIVGSSALLQDDFYVYAFGVKEPATHETYLLRFEKSNLMNGELSDLQWWVDNNWTEEIYEEPTSAALFTGQTEFSVHYEPCLKKYIQVQTYGIGKASIGYRLADQLYGPWSDPVFLYKPRLKEDQEFVYSANAHPELTAEGMIITYNINNLDFGRLVNNEEIYFPAIIRIEWEKDQ